MREAIERRRYSIGVLGIAIVSLRRLVRFDLGHGSAVGSLESAVRTAASAEELSPGELSREREHQRCPSAPDHCGVREARAVPALTRR